MIERGITIDGKLLRHHHEAIDHRQIRGCVRELAQQAARLAEIPPVISGHAVRPVVVATAPQIALGAYRRLLMNLLLLRDGQRPVTIRPQDRLRYLTFRQDAQAGAGTYAFGLLLYNRRGETLAGYLTEANSVLSGPLEAPGFGA